MLETSFLLRYSLCYNFRIAATIAAKGRIQVRELRAAYYFTMTILLCFQLPNVGSFGSFLEADRAELCVCVFCRFAVPGDKVGLLKLSTFSLTTLKVK